MGEWCWDLGADGVVRLMADGHGVETVYIGSRIAERTTATRDEPLFRSLLESTTIRDDALKLGGGPSISSTPYRPETITFPPNVAAGPPHTSSPSYAPRILDTRRAR